MNFHGDVLALSFTDDIVATGAAAEAFMRFYAKADSQTHRHINPKEYGIDSIGHSGYFREACLPLWKQLAEWIEAH